MAKIPRISGGAEQAGLGRWHQAEFRARTLAENGYAAVEKTLRQGAGVIGNVVPVQARARRGAGSLKQIEVFQQKRHAGKRPLGKSAVDLLVRVVDMFDQIGRASCRERV